MKRVKNQTEPEVQSETHPDDWSWRFWQVVPLYPYGKRRTLRKEVVKDTIWTFDQIQGIFYVVVPIRMTVIKLEAGGLLVYAPIAPTPECIRLVKELVAEHGDVKYVILPTSSGLEHKVFVGPFARQFPNAQIFVAPHQWSFPIDLPLSWLGFPAKRTQTLLEDSNKAPFCHDFDYAILDINLGAGSFGEVAFFHRRSQTLLVTDSVLSVPEDPPAIVQLDTYPLLFHAKDHASDVIEDTPLNRQKGWWRSALFAFYFSPSALETLGLGHVLRDALKASDRSKKAYFGLFPFKWRENWQRSFEALRGNGRLFVAPILQTIILNRSPEQTLAWADQVAKWDFVRVIPCHLDAPIAATPQQFRQAFSFLEEAAIATLPQEDFALLWQIEARLNRSGVTPPRGKV